MLNASSTGSGQPRSTRRQMDDQALSELSVVIPNLHWRYSGVTAANRSVAPGIGRHLRAGLVRLPRARWRAAFDSRGAVSAAHDAEGHEAVHLARAAQRRDAGGPAAENSGLAVQTDLHVGGTAPAYLAHPFSDRADGRRDRDQRRVGGLFGASGDGRAPWCRYRTPIARRPTARRHSLPADFRANTASAASAGCVRKRVPTCSSRRCVRCCRNIRIFPP